MTKWMERLARSTLFPEDFPCLGCGCEMELDSHHLCEKCAPKLEPITVACPVCGRSGGGGLCKDCKNGRKFVKAVSCYKYTGSCKGIIRALKYKDTLYAADFMAAEMAGICYFDEKPDLVTSVPSRCEALLRRGYNQSEELAKRCAAMLGVEYSAAMRQRRGAEAQHELSALQRRENCVKNIYGIYELEGRTVLLVDDVLTTGATADACAQVLLQNGAARVYVSVFASVPNFDEI